MGVASYTILIFFCLAWQVGSLCGCVICVASECEIRGVGRGVGRLMMVGMVMVAMGRVEDTVIFLLPITISHFIKFRFTAIPVFTGFSILYYLDEVAQITCFQATVLPSIPRSVELFLANIDFIIFFTCAYQISSENVISLGLYVEGWHVEGWHVEGWHVEGWHVEGWHVEGWHVEGWHVEGWHVEGWHVEGWHVEGWHVEGWHVEGWHVEGWHVEGWHVEV